MTGSFDRKAKIWDANTGQRYHTLKGHKMEIVCLSFDPHGMLVATGSMDNTAKLWDVETGQEIFNLQDIDFGQLIIQLRSGMCAQASVFLLWKGIQGSFHAGNLTSQVTTA